MESDKETLSNTAVEIITAVVLVILATAFIGAYVVAALKGYADFLAWFYERDWNRIRTIAAIIFIIIDCALIWLIGDITRRILRLNEKVVPRGEEAAAHTVPIETEIGENWGHIRELTNSLNSSDWNMAVLRADALLEDVLMHLGYEGETIAERLAVVDPTKLVSLDRVWSAHRLRNAIAHDPMEQHTREAIVYAIRSYEQAFKELGMM